MDPKKILIARRVTQLGIGVILLNSYYKVISTKIIYDGPLKAGCVPGLNCHACPFAVSSCPIGALQYFAAEHRVPLYLAGYLAIIGLIGGRLACGWLCPWGFLQDMMYKIKSIKFGIPAWMGHFRWFSLIILAIALPYYTGKHWFSALCPNGALIAGIPWALWNPIDPYLDEAVIAPGTLDFDFWLKIVILVIFLGWFVVSKRPFCRTACPLGLIYGWFNKFSLVMPKTLYTCPDCEECPSHCPVDLDVRTEINNNQCIKCLDCLECKFVGYEWNWSLFWYKIPLFRTTKAKREAAKLEKLRQKKLAEGNGD